MNRVSGRQHKVSLCIQVTQYEKEKCRNLDQPALFAMTTSLICGLSTAISAAVPQGSTKYSSFQVELQHRGQAENRFLL